MQFSSIVSLILVASMTVLSAMAASIPKPKCDKACTKEYDPVCGMLPSGEYKTFSNLCRYEVDNCKHYDQIKLLFEGECPEPPPTLSDGNRGCSDIYQPVCAFFANGEYRAFPSECGFNVYKCQHPGEKVSLVSGDKACNDF
ncbi:hypothetical protein BGX23_009496 [Mortierella sp. AD031]|nr:hypothetical protein BGX23_009496 [Mortierella sp. AD031]